MRCSWGPARSSWTPGALSTANSTDVTIVLKKAKAEAFRAEVESLLRGERAAAAAPGEEEETYDFRAGSGDIIRHGVCSMSVLSLLAVILGLVGSVVMAAEALGEEHVLDPLLRSAVSLLAAIAIILSAVWDIVKDFVRYLDFRVKRQRDRICIRYGRAEEGGVHHPRRHDTGAEAAPDTDRPSSGEIHGGDRECRYGG